MAAGILISMPLLDSLKRCTTVVADTVDIDAMRQQGRGDPDTLFIEKKQLAERAKELGCQRQFWK